MVRPANTSDASAKSSERRCRVARPLGWIESDFHLFYVVTIKAENASLPPAIVAE
jgi:hypothetical protein